MSKALGLLGAVYWPLGALQNKAERRGPSVKSQLQLGFLGKFSIHSEKKGCFHRLSFLLLGQFGILNCLVT